MSNLVTMRSRIKNALAIQDTIYDDAIDDSIRSALSQYRNQPFWFLQKIGTVTLLTDSDNVALPSDFASPMQARILVNDIYRGETAGFIKQEFKYLQEKYKAQTTSGVPQYYAYYGKNIYTDASANADYTIQLVYYQKDATLPQGDSDTSVWFDDGYDAIRTLAMAIFKDEALEYQSADRDWLRAKTYLDLLTQQNTQFAIGGDF